MTTLNMLGFHAIFAAWTTARDALGTQLAEICRLLAGETDRWAMKPVEQLGCGEFVRAGHPSGNGRSLAAWADIQPPLRYDSRWVGAVSWIGLAGSGELPRPTQRHVLGGRTTNCGEGAAAVDR